MNKKTVSCIQTSVLVTATEYSRLKQTVSVHSLPFASDRSPA